MKMEEIELYPHNQKAYDNLCAMLRDSNRACVVQRGGTAGGYHWEYLDEKKEVSTDDHHQADGRAE